MLPLLTIYILLQDHPGKLLGDQGFDLECLSLFTTQPRGGSDRKEGLSLKSLLPSSTSGSRIVPSISADIPGSVIKAWQSGRQAEGEPWAHSQGRQDQLCLGISGPCCGYFLL